MRYQKESHLHSLQRKFQKVCRQLQQLLQTGGGVDAKKIRSLIRRHKQYLQQMLSLNLSPVKAGSALAVAVLLVAQTDAQQCNQFNAASAANPIIQARNQGFSQPFFVDIDGDGDLDCYVTGGSRKPVFFKNEGTKTVP